MEAYTKALESQMKSILEKYGRVEFDTVYLGGGTPSILPLNMAITIMDNIDRYFKIRKEGEVTIEVNPGTVDLGKLMEYRKLGVNRLSMGVQSFKNDVLKSLGRGHSRKDVDEVIKWAREAGFKNISLDLIYGVPEEKPEDVLGNLKEAVSLGVEHISYYGLSIEPGTKLFRDYEEGKIVLPSEDQLVASRDLIDEFLEGQGFRQYEIANYSKPGYESQHNLIYWQCGDYLALGPGATSKWQGQRYENAGSLETFLKEGVEGKFSKENIQVITGQDQREEAIFLGLRLNKGISLEDYEERFEVKIEEIYKEQIKYLIECECLAIEGEFIRLTSKGRRLSNRVLSLFLQ